MNQISNKQLDSLRRQFPVGSRIKLREMKNDPFPVKPGSMGTLESIDDIGTFHVKWDDGRALGLVPGEDDFDLLPPSVQTLKLYMPMTATYYDEEDGLEINITMDPHEAAEYAPQIIAALQKEQSRLKSDTPEASERGLMAYFDKDDSVNGKVLSYMVLLNIAPFPNTGTPEASPEPVPIQLPASGAELQRVLERLKKPDWKGVMAAILDCPVPSMNKDIFLEENIPQVIEWAEALRTLDEAGCLHKYKALLKAEDCAEVTEALRLAGPLEEYEFDSALHTEEDVAAAFLTKNISGDLLEKILPHINLWQLGAGLLEASNGALTPYGAITRKDGQPFQIMNDQPGQGGMEMN